jgi:signal transduction histidine kinase/ActR/RegA family two-component response regulator
MGKLRAAILLSFRSKLLIPVLLIMVALVAAITWLVSNCVTAQFEAEASRTLGTADAVFRNSQQIRTKNLLLRFRSLQNEPRYRALFQARDPETARQFFQQEVSVLQSVDLMTLTLDDGSLLSNVKRDPLIPVAEFLRRSELAIQQALSGQECADTIELSGKLYDVISLPISGTDNQPLGALTIGAEIGNDVARELSAQTHCEVVMLAGDKVIASTMSGLMLDGQTLSSEPGSNGWVKRMLIENTHYFAAFGRFETLGAGSRLGYVLLSSYEQPLQALRATRQAIFLVSAIGILLGAVVVWFFVRRVVEPLERLRDGVEAVGRGDLSQRVEIASNDECGDLALVFNRMVGNLQSSRAELERTLETLRTTQNQLVQSEKLSGIGEFVAGVAHELNNPLTTVMGFSEMLHKNCADERQRHQLDMVFKSSRRCHKIVQNLLSFARQRQPERAAVDVNKVLQASAEFLDYQMLTSNVTLRYELADGLPSIHADPHQLQQVFINLLNNARQAIEAHQPSGSILIQTALVDGMVQVVLQDNGPGIPPENLSKIFNPFFTTKEVGKGTGLGLSLCYGIIREHGGQIHVSSEPGNGARFLIELPPGEEVAVVSGDTAIIHAEEKTVAGEGRRILVVDDEEGILEMLGELLQGLGFDVDTASNGEAALQRSAAGGYAAVFCDWRMPGLNGQQVYERLRRTQPALADRLIFVTGDVACENTRQFIENERRPFVVKPFTMRELRAALQQVLERN